MVQQLVLIGHVLVAALIVVVVLLQRGKGAEAGTGFGAGASATVFGSRGSANFFTRTTAVLAVLFFASSLTLAYFAQVGDARRDAFEGSVLEGTEPAERRPGVSPVDPAGDLPEVQIEEPEGGLPEIAPPPDEEASAEREPSRE